MRSPKDLRCLYCHYTEKAMLRSVTATRYVLPLREGGSLPAIVEADDSGMYVVKFRGAGQGPLALVAELVAGEIGRVLGLEVPEIVFVQIDAELGRNDPDAEIRHLLKASVGQNLALDYLPGSITFDPVAGDAISNAVASLAVWFDSFVLNIDRTVRNANLLRWHGQVKFIDHGAALYPHHQMDSMLDKALVPLPALENHVLLPWADDLKAASSIAHERLSPQVLASILEQVPDAWLAPTDHSFAGTPAERRGIYLEFLQRRLAASHIFEQEAMHVRARLI
ncbi:MAG: HipA family kinase [Edaphobacter sp.]